MLWQHNKKPPTPSLSLTPNISKRNIAGCIKKSPYPRKKRKEKKSDHQQEKAFSSPAIYAPHRKTGEVVKSEHKQSLPHLLHFLCSERK